MHYNVKDVQGKTINNIFILIIQIFFYLMLIQIIQKDFPTVKSMPIPYKDQSKYSVKEKKNVKGTTNLLYKSYKLMLQQM